MNLQDLAAPLAVRPRSFLAFSDSPARFHRRGRRSACAFAKRTEHWRSQFDSLRARLSDDNGQGADDAVVVIRGENFQETNPETINSRSRHAGPPAPRIVHTILFLLNP